MKLAKNLLKYVCALSLMITPTMGWSDDGVVTVKGDTETATQQNVQSPSVKDNSDKSKDKNKSGQALSMITGGILVASGVAMISTGSSNQDYSLVAMGVMTVGMGMMSFAQGGAHGSTASGSGLTSGLTNGYTDGTESGGGLVDVPTSVSEQTKGDLAKLAAMGVYNPKTGTLTANGKTYSASDFSSPASMAAAGFSEGAIKGAMAYGNKASKDAVKKLGAMTAANGYAEGGGGGGGSSASAGGSGYDGSGAGAGYAAAPKYNMERDPSSLAGMQKNYNGDPIGVSADSIFLMMSRRYKVKESQQSFYDEMELALRK